MELPTWFLGTAAGKVAVAEAESAREVERRQLVAQLETLDGEREKSALMLTKKVSEAAAKLAAARDAARKAVVAHSLALSASLGASTAHAHRRGQLVVQLRRLSPDVQAFIRELRELHTDALKGDVLHRHYQVRGKFIDVTNVKSIAARAAAIMAGIAGAEALIVADVDDAGLAMEAIRASIPEVEEPEFAVA